MSTEQEILPTKGSLWLHKKSNNEYRVQQITNRSATDKRYPITIVYKDKNGNVWSKPFSEWYGSMVLQKEHIIVQIIREYFLLDKFN